MEWVRTATDVELAQMKLVYAAVYMCLGIMAVNTDIDVRPKNLRDLGDSDSMVSSVSQDWDVPPALKDPEHLKVPASKRFQPIDKLISIGRKGLKGLDKKACIAKFRWLCRDNSDKLVLRYIRQLGESRQVVSAICEAIAWNLTECNTEELLRQGEAYSVFDKPNVPYLKQFEVGKRQLAGFDRQGRPINILTARRHFGSAQSSQDLEKFSLFMFEQTFMTMRDDVDGCVIIFDMQGFKHRNMDFKIARFIVEKFNRLYPMMMVKLFVYKAPKMFRAAYKVIKPWFDQRLTDKITFIETSEDLLAMIPAEQLPTQLGGNARRKYQWIPPRYEDDAPLRDTATRNELLRARANIFARIEQLTAEWITQINPVRLAGLEQERRFLLEECRRTYWILDPYVRSRTIFDRNGVFGLLRPELAEGGLGQPVCKATPTMRELLAPLVDQSTYSGESCEQATLAASSEFDYDGVSDVGKYSLSLSTVKSHVSTAQPSHGYHGTKDGHATGHATGHANQATNGRSKNAQNAHSHDQKHRDHHGQQNGLRVRAQ